MRKRISGSINLQSAFSAFFALLLLPPWENHPFFPLLL